MKLCLAASSGGHLEEVMCLKDWFSNHDICLVTEYVNNVQIDKNINIHYLKQVNRKELAVGLNLLVNLYKSLVIVGKEKPDVIISTGALSTIPLCVAAKLFRKKIVYIESFARVDSPSLTGKFMYKISDLFIVQWPELKKFYPNSILTGGIF